MLFTEGKDRVFERMMQEKPGFNKKHGARRDVPRKSYATDLRYRYDDLACVYCADYRKGSCPHAVCPYIMDNLDDLVKDPAFIAAMSEAKNCDTPHRNTLLSLNEKYDDSSAELETEGFAAKKKQSKDLRYRQTGGIDCAYPAHSIICDAAGDCRKTAMAAQQGMAPCRV